MPADLTRVPNFSSSLVAHSQSFFSIQAQQLLVVHMDTLTLQQKAQAPEPEATATELKAHPCPSTIATLVQHVTIQQDKIMIAMHDLTNVLSENRDGQSASDREEDHHVITREMRIKRSSHGKRIVLGEDAGSTNAKSDPSLLKAIARAHQWLNDMKAGVSYKEIADRDGIDQRHVARTIRLAFLAPDITEAILKGNEPRGMATDQLLRHPNLPADWQEQRDLLGFS